MPVPQVPPPLAVVILMPAGFLRVLQVSLES